MEDRAAGGTAGAGLPAGGPGGGASGPDLAHEEALCRLEDVLLSLPMDRALPGLDALLRAARVGPELLEDDRAHKLLHEALLARPLGDLEVVQTLRTEVELLSVEVSVLSERLLTAGDTGGTTRRDEAADRARLAVIRARLAAIRRVL